MMMMMSTTMSRQRSLTPTAFILLSVICVTCHIKLSCRSMSVFTLTWSSSQKRLGMCLRSEDSHLELLNPETQSHQSPSCLSSFFHVLNLSFNSLNLWPLFFWRFSEFIECHWMIGKLIKYSLHNVTNWFLQPLDWHHYELIDCLKRVIENVWNRNSIDWMVNLNQPQTFHPVG